MNKLVSVLVNVVAASHLCPRQVRLAVYRAVGMNVGRVDVRVGVAFSGTRCSIGDRSWINQGTFFDCDGALVEIGQNVGVAMGVTFVTTGHQTGPPERRAGTLEFKPIRVEDGAWIGAGAVILPGCTIGKGCIVAAGAVVTKSCDPNGLYAGVPARRIREL